MPDTDKKTTNGKNWLTHTASSAVGAGIGYAGAVLSADYQLASRIVEGAGLAGVVLVVMAYLNTKEKQENAKALNRLAGVIERLGDHVYDSIDGVRKTVGDTTIGITEIGAILKTIRRLSNGDKNDTGN